MSQWYKGELVHSEMKGKKLRIMTFKVPNFPRFKAGQHCDLKLTAPDGYSATRSYSILSSPSQSSADIVKTLSIDLNLGLNDTILQFGIEIIPNGEVSSYLNIMPLGETLDILGPIGGHFNWELDVDRPLVLIGGGSGTLPLYSIAKEFLMSDKENKLTFIGSFRSIEDIPMDLVDIVDDEMAKRFLFECFLTQAVPKDWPMDRAERLTPAALSQILSKNLSKNNRGRLFYICGSNSFVQDISKWLVRDGVLPADIKAERFG